VPPELGGGAQRKFGGHAKKISGASRQKDCAPTSKPCRRLCLALLAGDHSDTFGVLSSWQRNVRTQLSYCSRFHIEMVTYIRDCGSVIDIWEMCVNWQVYSWWPEGRGSQRLHISAPAERYVGLQTSRQTRMSPHAISKCRSRRHWRRAVLQQRLLSARTGQW